MILNAILPLLTSCWGFPFALGMGYLLLVGFNNFLPMPAQQRVVILEFLQEIMSARPSTPLSCQSFSLPLDMGYLFLVGSNVLLLMAVHQLVAILVFLQKLSARPSTPPS